MLCLIYYTIGNNECMSKFKFVNIIDVIFLSIITFFIIFAWVQFFLKNFFLSLFISAILAISVMFGIKYIKFRKYSSKQQALASNSNLIRFKLAIQTMPSSKLALIIKKLIPSKYLPKITKSDICFTKDNSIHSFTFFYSTPLNDTKVLDIIKTQKADNITIFCSSFDKDAKLVSSAFKNKKIELINLDQLYEIFNHKNIEIDTNNIDLNKNKITFREILKNSLSHEKSKGYFISGLILLFTSIIIPYRLYYVIFSSVLFLLSLLCQLRTTEHVNHSIFD